jgi:hypothetical protein
MGEAWGRREGSTGGEERGLLVVNRSLEAPRERMDRLLFSGLAIIWKNCVKFPSNFAHFLSSSIFRGKYLKVFRGKYLSKFAKFHRSNLHNGGCQGKQVFGRKEE